MWPVEKYVVAKSQLATFVLVDKVHTIIVIKVIGSKSEFSLAMGTIYILLS